MLTAIGSIAPSTITPLPIDPQLPRPLKHLRYPWKQVAKEKPMTIAAGFLTDEGILLCADSQFTGAAKIHQQKVFGHVQLSAGKENVVIAFALGGNEVYGKMAIEDCADAIQSCKREELTLRKTRQLLRGAVKAIHEQYVDSRPDAAEKENAHFDLVIGCWLPLAGGLKLFRTSGPGVVGGDEYCCIGTGYYLGDYLMRNIFKRSMRIKEVALLAIQAVSAAKTYDPFCGGITQFMTITPPGKLSNFVSYNVQDAELYVSQFERASRKLLFEIGDTGSEDKEFDAKLSQFTQEVKRIRRYWKNGGAPMYQELIERLAATKAAGQLPPG